MTFECDTEKEQLRPPSHCSSVHAGSPAAGECHADSLGGEFAAAPLAGGGKAGDITTQTHRSTEATGSCSASCDAVATTKNVHGDAAMGPGSEARREIRKWQYFEARTSSSKGSRSDA